LVNAATKRPVDKDALDKARSLLRDKYGEGTLTEAAVALGFKDGMTKMTDGVGKTPMPAMLLSVLTNLFGILRFFFELWTRISGRSG